MADNDMKRIVRGLSKLENSNGDEYDGDVKAAARELIRDTIVFNVASTLANAADAVLANANEARRMRANGRVIGAYVILKSGDITAAGADNATLAVHVLPGNGAAGSAVASQTTNTTANSGTGNIVNGQVVELTVQSDPSFTKGETLAPQVSQNGSGVAVPTATFVVDVEYEGTSAADYPI